MKAIFIISLLSSATILSAQESSKIPEDYLTKPTMFSIPANTASKDSLSLEKYLPRQKISSIEFLFGYGIVGVRGSEEPAARFGQSIYINPLETKFGFSLGVGASHNINRILKIEARLLYENKGYVRSLDTISFDNNFNIISKTRVWTEVTKNNYLTLSLLPQFVFVLGGKVRYNIGVGIYGGYLRRSKMDFFQSSQFIYSTRSLDKYNKHDGGLCFNTGFSYPIKSKFEIMAQLHVSYGLYYISDRLVSFNYPKWYNCSYSLLVGVRFLNRRATYLNNRTNT